ncbi:hypothetical protein [Phaeobacter sp. C3_T13_0]|uniref:hypothetical protein n=1 Tax=Phaeobacter cretensis TaxID=3342641 RepID=UPI0039BCA83C
MRVLHNKFPTNQLVQRLLKRSEADSGTQHTECPRIFLRSEGTSSETVALQDTALRSFTGTA